MLTVIQIIDSDSQGHKVRLSDGSLRYLRLHPGYSPTIGTEVEVDSSNWGIVQHPSSVETEFFDAPEPIGHTSIEIVKSEADFVANTLSQHVHSLGENMAAKADAALDIPFMERFRSANICSGPLGISYSQPPLGIPPNRNPEVVKAQDDANLALNFHRETLEFQPPLDEPGPSDPSGEE